MAWLATAVGKAHHLLRGILVTWATYFMAVHFFSVGGEVTQDNLVSNVLIKSTYRRKNTRLLFHATLIKTFHFPQIKSSLCELVAALSFMSNTTAGLFAYA